MKGPEAIPKVFLQDLGNMISIASVSGKEGPLAAHIANEHEKLKHEVHRIGNGVIVRIHGEDRSAAFFLNGHIDTVPDTGWQAEPYALSEENGKFVGLGINDMKNGLAVMQGIARKYAKEKPPSDVILLFSDMEEVDGSGTVRLMDWLVQDEQWKNYRKKGGLILEPTRDGNQMVLCNGQKGGALLTVEATGPSGHAGRDYSNDPTALTKLTRFMGRALDLQELWTRNYSDDEFGHPTVIPTKIFDGSDAGNVVAPYVKGFIDVRTTPALNKAWAEIKPRLEKEYGVRLSFSLWPKVEMSDRDSDIYRSARMRMPNIKVTAFPLASDLSTFITREVPMLIYGAGSINDIHIPGESMDLSVIPSFMDDIDGILHNFANS